MKIRTLFYGSLILFILLLTFGVITRRLPRMDVLIAVSLCLAVLSTQWFLPICCGRLAHLFVKANRPGVAEQIARFGIAVGKPWDGQFFRGTNLPRHMTPTMSCSNFLRLALHNQGKFAEIQKLDKEILQIVEEENGTAEGRGTSKAKLAGSMHKTGNTVKALILINQAIDQFSLARLDERSNEAGDEAFMKGRERAFGSERAHALFIRASILESIRRYEEAVPDREQALKVSQETFGSQSKQITPHLTMLGKLFVKMKQFDRAEPLLQQSLSLRLEQLKPGDKLIASAQLSLSDYYRELGDLEKAESMIAPAFETAMKNYSQSPGPGLAEYFQSMAFLRQKQMRQEEAEIYFRQSRETYLKYFPKEHPILYELNLRMIDLLTSTGRSRECEPLERENAKLAELFEEAGRNVRSCR